MIAVMAGNKASISPVLWEAVKTAYIEAGLARRPSDSEDNGAGYTFPNPSPAKLAARFGLRPGTVQGKIVREGWAAELGKARAAALLSTVPPQARAVSQALGASPESREAQVAAELHAASVAAVIRSHMDDIALLRRLIRRELESLPAEHDPNDPNRDRKYRGETLRNLAQAEDRLIERERQAFGMEPGDNRPGQVVMVSIDI